MSISLLVKAPRSPLVQCADFRGGLAAGFVFKNRKAPGNGLDMRGTLGDRARSDVHAVLGKDGASLIGEAAARRGGGEDYAGGDAREARSIAGSGSCVHVEESGPARNQDKVGRPRGR